MEVRVKREDEPAVIIFALFFAALTVVAVLAVIR